MNLVDGRNDYYSIPVPCLTTHCTNDLNFAANYPNQTVIPFRIVQIPLLIQLKPELKM
jgi:hypothetical protein